MNSDGTGARTSCPRVSSLGESGRFRTVGSLLSTRGQDVRAPVFASLIIVAFATAAFAQSTAFIDDFNDENDDGWTRVGPANYQGPPVYSFPDGAYRIQVPAANSTFYAAGGFSYAIGLRPELNFADFVASLDFIAENTNLNNMVSIVARASGDSFANNFHVAAFNNHYGLGTYRNSSGAQVLYIFRTSSSGLATLVQTNFARVAGRQYRLVFSGIGSRLAGNIFDRENLGTPLATVSADNPALASGYLGFLALDFAGVTRAGNNAMDVTLDNFIVGPPGSAPSLTYQRSGLNAIQVTWPAAAVGYVLEGATNVLGPWPRVQALPEVNGTNSSVALPTSGSARFFRLRDATVMP